MAILFVGAEVEDFTSFGTVSFYTSTSAYRTAYARGGVSPDGGAFAVNYARASFTPSSSFWATARMFTGVVGYNTDNVFLWFSTTGGSRLRLKVNSGSPATITLQSVTSGGVTTALATSTATLTINTTYRLDIQVSYGTSGRIRVFIDGVSAIDTGIMDVTASGTTTLESLNLASTRASSGNSTAWSEVIVADEDTRPLSVKTLVPDATGDVTGWTSGTWADIDDATAADVDLAVSDTVGQVLSVNCTGMPSGASGLSVRAVKLVAFAARGASGPSKLDVGLRQSSTNGFASSQTLDTGYGAITATWTTNPITGSAFTSSEIASIQLAYRSAT